MGTEGNVKGQTGGDGFGIYNLNDTDGIWTEETNNGDSVGDVRITKFTTRSDL